MIEGKTAALPKRNLTEETAKKWRYEVGKFKGKSVQIANYLDEAGKVAAQKLRFANKDFTVVGNLKDALPLFGQHLWRDKGRMVVVTEGEIDAMSVSQLQGHKYPVVSLPNGAQGAKKSVAKALDWLLGFEVVVFMFDMDDPGKEAASECAALLPPGRAKIAALPLKDANDMLKAGRGAEVIDAIWGAKEYRPDGVVSLKDIRDRVLAVPETGLPWVFPTLTKHTFGRRYGELYFVGAGTGVGKTDFLTQQITFDVVDLGQKVGVFFFEQQPEETGKRLAGKLTGKRFHIPDGTWEQPELIEALDKLDAHDGLRFYDHFGVTEWDVVKARIRYMAHAEGIRIFYLDHLTAFAAGAEDERKELERIMGELGGLVKELNIMMTAVSHLSTPEGKPHEEGGRVMIRHFKGSRSIGYWSHFMFGLERNTQSDDPEERGTTTFRILKDRNTGNATGETFALAYDRDTGRLFETDMPVTDGGMTSDDSKPDF
ncbi:MAG: toprim domain-containing protein [Reyranella sp.]|uniref:DnaB-like helicase C-terminal domain-containing protein n=1 Tax=Reyranella sp. TaxID=1929291 RepID=UPI00122797B4|nr:DnaB-like helicase C-terminal domain-containing protein [Reyranella sp.]TBR30671.1 MAG: toprim domain-containing protein [Reyranella sp.]